MATWIGYFNKAGGPCLKITLSGLAGTETDFEALIDTGFTGFVSIPLVAAFPLGLPLFGVTNLVVANGSITSRLTAFAKVTIGEDEGSGIVVLETGTGEVLLGMEFLKTFKKRLIVCPSTGVMFEDA